MDRSGRTIHVLDLEYLGCGPSCAGADLETILHRFRAVADWHGHDLGVGAVSTWTYKQIAFDLPHDLRVWPAGGGPHAADRRLLAELDPRWVAQRFDRLVIGSGDHAFADLVLDLRAAGVRTCVVGWSWNIATRLRDAAHAALHLDGPALAA